MAERPARIAGYEIEGEIGRGGMAVVYLARQPGLNRRVALKVLAPELARDERFRSRFMRESRIAATLEHPNVIPIFEAGDAGGHLFIAMRYIEASDLKSLIAREGPLDTARALAIVEQIARALDEAHARGLVHRDVKPANVLVAPGSEPGSGEHAYLSDFGLTREADSRSGLTMTGQFVGSIHSSSPEQIEGRPIDARADIYSLGCVLFECITGRVAFERDSPMAVMYAHINDARPSACAIRPDLPREIDPVIARALAVDPTRRYASCGDLVVAARAALAGTAVEPLPRAPIPRRARLAVAAVLGLAVAGGALGVVLAQSGSATSWFTFRGADHDVYRVATTAGARPENVSDAMDRLANRPDVERPDLALAVASDGGALLVTTRRFGCDVPCAVLLNADLGSQELVRARTGDGLIHPDGPAALATGGDLIVFASASGAPRDQARALFVVEREGDRWGEPRAVTDESPHRDHARPALSPDGSMIVFSCGRSAGPEPGTAVCRVGVDGSSFETLVRADDGPGATRASTTHNPGFAPDGSVVFEADWGGSPRVWRSGAGVLARVGDFTDDTHPCVLADGRIASLWFGGSDRDGLVKVMLADGSGFEVLAVPGPIRDGGFSCA